MTQHTLPGDLEGWLRLLESRHPRTIDLGLERVAAVWSNMGKPRPARKIFTIAGTNGKGSTAAMICALLDALGFRYGSYTTPHLLQYNERVQLDGQPVGDAALLRAFSQVEAARGEQSLSYFEFGTLAAFALLRDADLDFAVLEVGLGGRLDAVNILDTDCAVITPIGLDHQEYLGGDLDSIAHEKAGIMRPGIPVICAQKKPPPPIAARANELNVRLLRAGVEFDIESTEGACEFRDGANRLVLPNPRLAGAHQRTNMATAVAAVLSLIPEAARRREELVRGLESASLPGRLQRVSRRPPVLVDVGHNPMAAGAVAAALVAGSKPRGWRCVLGMLEDKDVAGVVAELEALVRHWYCAGLGGSRGQSGAELAERVRAAGPAADVEGFAHVAQALETALAECPEGEGILVFGSFLTAAGALEFWRREHSGAHSPTGTAAN